ncbi:MAG: glycosyltransferase [Bacteroidales bacterium]|nr:glycosyltransferase [Bacteroidales bacterium]HOK98029.1 glycosyltransferase [Bacteroidales bacterium]HPO64441.1 glycosyltransferase [Bacteroidales bacterium]
MKAILIGPAHPLRGGIANFNESLAIAFIKNSIETTIVSYYYQYPRFLFPGETQTVEGKPTYLLKIKPLISSINPFSWLKTARYLSHESPDIVVVQFWLPYLAPALGSILRLFRGRNTKIIGIMHNVFPHEKRFADKLLTRYFINSCHGFICLSKSVLLQLETLTPNPNKLFVPHPIYDIFGDKVSKTEARKHLGLSDADKVLLFFGIIRKYKGLELLLRAIATDRVKKLNVKLIVAGEFYEDKRYYFQLAEQLNIKHQIVFTDRFIPNDEVKYYFCAADMVVQPYLSATQSGVTQVAYNFERPMLVTNVGGLSEIVFDRRTGYVTEVNAEAIAQAIEDFYVNNREDEMAANVLAEQYRFSWHAMVDSLLQLAESIKK